MQMLGVLYFCLQVTNCCQLKGNVCCFQPSIILSMPKWNAYVVIKGSAAPHSKCSTPSHFLECPLSKRWAELRFIYTVILLFFMVIRNGSVVMLVAHDDCVTWWRRFDWSWFKAAETKCRVDRPTSRRLPQQWA